VNALLHIVFIALGLALFAFNRRIGTAMDRLGRVVVGEGYFGMAIVYRVMIGGFGAALAYTVFKDWLISN
jgi:hypothetical protein